MWQYFSFYTWVCHVVSFFLVPGLKVSMNFSYPTTKNRQMKNEWKEEQKQIEKL
jgi:hypothetical protein